MATPETQRLVSAIQDFLDNPPKGTPPEILDGLGKVGQLLSAGPPGPQSPGRKAVSNAVGKESSGGVPGKEGPSAGSRAAVAAQMAQ